MADPTMRDVLEQLATLQGTVREQGAELAAHRRQRRRRRATRRPLPLLLAALFVALIPLASLAANPFTDLTGGVHDGNIDAIYNAGITTGCVPNVSYCPTDLVTRQEMASFLARTAGIGGNPPVANARTAQTAVSAQTADTATNATNAQNAVNAQNAANATTASHASSADTATNATNATNAANADKLDGYDADALNRIAFSQTRLAIGVPSSLIFTTVGQVTITIPGPTPQAVHVRGALGLRNQPGGGRVTTRLFESGGALSDFGYFPYLTDTPGTGIMVYNDHVFTAAPGTHTYQFAINHTVPGTLTTTALILTATTHPFGNSGGAGATEIEPVAPEPAR